MSYPHEIVKVTLSGDMFGGAEIWSTGFYMGHEVADADPITDAGMDQLGTAWGTFFSAVNSGIANVYTFKTLKMVRLSQNGATLTDTAKYWAPPAAVTGGYAGFAQPPQIALVATLANSLPRGLATKGRMFLPGVSWAPDATGHIDATKIGTLSTNLQSFFNGIINDADMPGNPVLASKGRGPLLVDGAVRHVNTIKVGNVYDTQRRRRNALAETYTAKVLTNPI